eukprot:s4527_g4.t1
MAASAAGAKTRPSFDRLWRFAASRVRLPILALCLVVVLVHADRTTPQSVSEDDSDRAMREARNFRLNLGHALDVLRRDVPHMFDASYDLDYSIFSPSVVAEDARLPNVQMKGLSAWHPESGTTCDHHKMEIQSISVPVNSVVYVRWRLQIWPKDPLVWKCQAFLPPAWRLSSLPLYGYGAAVEPTILEGYSKYDFDVWSGEIVKHSVEINLPPMFLKDVVQPVRHFHMTIIGIVPGMVGLNPLRGLRPPGFASLRKSRTSVTNLSKEPWLDALCWD